MQTYRQFYDLTRVPFAKQITPLYRYRQLEELQRQLSGLIEEGGIVECTRKSGDIKRQNDTISRRRSSRDGKRAKDEKVHDGIQGEGGEAG